MSACEKACGLIDMRDHQGVHPCMGAVDLVPIYPLGEEVGVEDCAEQARGDFPFLIPYFSIRLSSTVQDK